MDNKTYGFIGLGLIGGSMARAIKNAQPDCTIMAYAPHRSTVDAAKADGKTALICAALGGGSPYEGCVESVRALLDAGADIHARSKRGWTALMTAAYYGNDEIVRVLLDAGADAATVDENGNTALALAISARGHWTRDETAELLRQHAANDGSTVAAS